VSDVYALVRSIRDKRLPRNRYYAEHATEDGAAARRLHRFLRGVERDLLTARDVCVTGSEAGYRVSMRFPSVRLTREVALTREEHALLVEDPRLAVLLDLHPRG
jgi:hypothetical protein